MDRQANASKQIPSGMCISDPSCVKPHVQIQGQPANPKGATANPINSYQGFSREFYNEIVVILFDKIIQCKPILHYEKFLLHRTQTKCILPDTYNKEAEELYCPSANKCFNTQKMKS